MDFKQIQELIKIINKSNIGELTIEQKDFRVTIKQKEDFPGTRMTMQPASAPVQMFHPQSGPEAPAATNVAPETPAGNEVPASNIITIKSPMIGTFYRKSSPDKPNLVDIGTDITPGKVVCIIEAMKLFNEIESEIKGKVVKVLVEDASPVEYDQPLFLVEPS